MAEAHKWAEPVVGQGREQVCRLCGVRRSQQEIPCQPDLPQPARPESSDYDPFE